MQLNTISAYETSAKDFFQKLAEWNTDLVLDVRLHNTNQLAGFTKERDLAYFVETIQHADYVHDTLYSPDQEVLKKYLDHKLTWEQFFADYRAEMEERDAIPQFIQKYGEYDSIALVGTATHKRRSHVEVLKSLVEEQLDAQGKN